MKRSITGLLLAIVVLQVTDLTAQQVTVSREITTRNDYAYDVMGQLEDRILLYRDKGSEKIVEVYATDLKFLYERELALAEKKAQVYGVATTTDRFNVFSGYRRKGKYYLLCHGFNKDIQPIDTTVLLDGAEDFAIKSFRYTLSADKSKTLLFAAISDDLMQMYVIDNQDVQVLWWKEILVKDFDMKGDFVDALLTNSGEANILYYDKNKESLKGEAQFLLLGSDAGPDVYVNKLKVDKKYVIDVECRYDQRNNKIALGGLASDDSEHDADSYFFFSRSMSELAEINQMSFRNFDRKFIEDVYGKKLSKRKQLDDFLTKDVIIRNDGGMILVTEMEKEFYRRSGFNTVGRNSEGFGRGWVDIYNEDIIIISINPDGSEHWKKILYKKQFSQDDDGVFSSFYIFKNPSQLRLIYNDEVKNNITVSEYVINPLGRQERNSLLSTEYQNLKLRWQEAVQISPTALLVPSENNYKLSLVKVDYAYKS